MSLTWDHHPGSTIPYKAKNRTYTVGEVYTKDGIRFRAIWLGCLKAAPLEGLFLTPEEGVKVAEAHWASINAPEAA